MSSLESLESSEISEEKEPTPEVKEAPENKEGPKIDIETPNAEIDRVPEIPRGWTYLKHGTNLIKWGSENPYNSDHFTLTWPLSVVSREEYEEDLRMSPKFNTTSNYSTVAVPKDMSEEDFRSKNVPFEIRVLFYQDHVRHAYDPEFKHTLDKETLDLIAKYYYRNQQFGRHPLVPKGETLVKIGHAKENDLDVFYYIPQTVAKSYSDSLEK